MIYVFLADGFEEIEALTPVDFLRRAGIDVKTVAVSGKSAVGSHNIEVKADMCLEDIVLDENTDGIILPGGMPGSKNLDENKTVQNAIDYCVKENRLLCAICAAPFILGKKGVLQNKNATCFPGFECYLKGANVRSDGVVRSGNIITAKGAGVAWEFGCEIAAAIIGKEKAEEILNSVQWRA